ncbi:GGDEF domain-containing protein [Peribacillus kribbensis]|uniref:GGDEF domain-containing protein n=1 Tax=Peribacillus kribbensis TaxID=356658 RepID=UPI000404F989|nr:diguanylate cyclase [Peribacillus kribbensis]
MVLKGFFINFTILFTLTFIIHKYLFSDRFTKISSTKQKIMGGLLHGLFGVILMQFGIPVEGSNGVLIDLRTIPIMIASYFGGWISAFITTTIIIICRLTFYPISEGSIINVFVLTLSAIAFSLINYSSIKRNQKWILMAALFIVIIGIGIHILIPDFKLATIVYVQYALSIVFATFGTYMLKSYLWQSQDNLKQLKEYAQKDYLTGLNNVRSFNTKINSALSKAINFNEKLSFIMIDIDHFKKINDTYGHLVGDIVLKQLGDILVKSSRSIDIISRNGGEEFSIIMPDCDSISARRVAERIRQVVEQHVFVLNGGAELKITVSIGYCTAKPKDSITVQELIHQADEALYNSKRTGRNRISSLPNYQSHII